MRAIVLALLAGLALAGCTTPAPGVPEPTISPPEPGVPAAFSVPNDASDCFEAILLVLVDLADAQAHLPANWTAADVQSLLQTPAPTGKGAVWLNGYYCAKAAFAGGADLHGAEIGIVVAPPTLSMPVNGSDAALHIYQFAQVSPIGEVQSTLGSVGVPVIPGHVEASHTPLLLAREGSLEVANETGTHYVFNYGALEDAPMTTTAAFWHETPAGLARFHFSLEGIAVQRGAVYACTLTGLAAELAGSPSCTPGESLAMIAPEQAWTSTFAWTPGAHAVAS